MSQMSSLSFAPPLAIANATVTADAPAVAANYSHALPPLLSYVLRRLRRNHSYDNERKPRLLDVMGASVWAANSLTIAPTYADTFGFDRSSYMAFSQPVLSVTQHAVSFEIQAPNIWRNMCCCSVAHLELHPDADNVARCHLSADAREFREQDFGSVCKCVVARALDALAEGPGWELCLDFSGRLVLTDLLRPRTRRVASFATLNDGRHHHVLISKTSNSLALTVNGLVAGTISIASSSSSSSDTTTNAGGRSSFSPLLQLGSIAATPTRWRHGSSATSFTGYIRSIKVWPDQAVESNTSNASGGSSSSSSSSLLYSVLREMRPPDGGDDLAIDQLSHAYADKARNKQQQRAGASASSTSCVPDGVVLTTFVNDHQLDHLRLQLGTMPPCLKAKYFVLCALTAEARRRDLSNTHACGMDWGGGSEAADFAPTPTRAFTLVTWLRWEMMHLALTAPGVKAVLWLDADVIVIRNPFLYPAIRDRAHPILGEGGLGDFDVAGMNGSTTTTTTMPREPTSDMLQAPRRWTPSDLGWSTVGLLYQQEFQLNSTDLHLPSTIATSKRFAYTLRDVVHLAAFGANLNTGVLLSSSEPLVRTVLETRAASPNQYAPPGAAGAGTTTDRGSRYRWEQPVANEAVLSSNRWHLVPAHRGVLSSRCWFSAAEPWSELLGRKFHRRDSKAFVPFDPNSTTPMPPYNESLAQGRCAPKPPHDTRLGRGADICSISTYHANCAATSEAGARARIRGQRQATKLEHMVAVWRLAVWCEPWCRAARARLQQEQEQEEQREVPARDEPWRVAFEPPQLILRHSGQRVLDAAAAAVGL